MNLIQSIRTAGQSIFDLLFPIYCLVCKKSGTYLCGRCFLALPKPERQTCGVCQLPSPFGKTHPDCASRNKIDGLVAALSYKDKTVKELIKILKYKFVYDLSDPLARLLAEEIKTNGLENYFQEFTLIPVPLHRKRFNWRGFNQAEKLAEVLKAQLAIPYSNQLVVRTKYTKPQTGLKAEQRKTNIQNAFAVLNKVPNQKFLIIDDVITTGSTVNEIAKSLKKQGAKEVWAISIARD